jgi:hypothetical protein
MGCQLCEDDPDEKVAAWQVEVVEKVVLDSSPASWYAFSLSSSAWNTNLLALKYHCCLQYRDKVMCGACPQFPMAFPIPVLPQVSPHLRQFILHTEVICLLNSPSPNGFSIRCHISRDAQVGTVVLLYHGDNCFMVFNRAEGTSANGIVLFAYWCLLFNSVFSQICLCCYWLNLRKLQLETGTLNNSILSYHLFSHASIFLFG